MGSCVSLNKDHSDSAMKFRLSFSSKNDKLIIPSPIKEDKTNPPLGISADGGAVKSQWSTITGSRDFGGSKEEAFFDSQAWLESDCEDDFFSVNGDFTPSCGNTPLHHSFEGRKSNYKLESSHTDKKKRLSELFKESQGDVEEQKATVSPVQVPLKSENGTPFVSGLNSVCSSERSPNSVVLKPHGEKPLKSAQCCLPRLRSFSERKKGRSPALNVGA